MNPMSLLTLPELNGVFLLGLIEIIVINLVLSGDNAVVIAMAVKRLPRNKRLVGIAFGSGLAVVLRVVLTFFAAQLLEIQYLKIIGGALIFWIACKLLIEDTEGGDGREATTMWSAIWIILIADVTMSTDNILALAAASKGNAFLFIFGLVLSIPLVVFTSTILSRLMERYPVIVVIGAAILGKVAAELIFSDPVVMAFLTVDGVALYALEGLCALAVIVTGKLYARQMRQAAVVASGAGLIVRDEEK
jgi:YjbE family integral membrane protein